MKVRSAATKTVKIEDVAFELFDYNPERREVGKFHVTKKKLITAIGSKYPYVDHIFEYGAEQVLSNQQYQLHSIYHRRMIHLDSERVNLWKRENLIGRN